MSWVLLPDREQEEPYQSPRENRSVADANRFSGGESEKGYRSRDDEPSTAHACHIAQSKCNGNDNYACYLPCEDWQHALVETLAVNTSIVRVALAVEF